MLYQLDSGICDSSLNQEVSRAEVKPAEINKKPTQYEGKQRLILHHRWEFNV